MSLFTSIEIDYPESDGQPLADNTIQFRLIVTIHGGIETLFSDNPNVFVAGDLFWYPVEGEPGIKQAPDVMVVFGRPKGDRRSYKQWLEDNIPPQVVFEIASKSNTIEELEEIKRDFYERYDVEEYYIFNPDKGTLKGWIRRGETLNPITRINGWVSPRLLIRFELLGGNLQLYRPDGERFATYLEVMNLKELERQRVEQAEQEKNLQRQRAEQAEQEKNLQQQRAEQAEQAQRNAIPKLLAMGLSVEQIAEVLSLPIETVRTVAQS